MYPVTTPVSARRSRTADMLITKYFPQTRKENKRT